MASKVREKIVVAAMDRFHALGYTATGVQEIVDTAGVPKGSFYNYFKAKELLAVEVFHIYMQAAQIEKLQDQTVPPSVRLREHFEGMADHFARFGYDKGCLVGTLAAEISTAMPVLRDAVRASLQQWSGQIAAVIREGQQDGCVDKAIDAERLARVLLDAWEGTVVRMKYTASREPLDDFFAVVLPLATGSR